MASPAPLPHSEPVAPAADPVAIRACLTSGLRTEFDHEWELVLDRAKESKDLTGVHDLLNKWRHIAYGEMVEPGRHYRVLAKAEEILRTGKNPGAKPLSVDEIKAKVAERRR